MPIVIICSNPGCGRKLRIQDQFLGTRMRCPHCRTAFDAPAEAPAPEEEEPPPVARRRSARDEDEADKPRRRPAAEEPEVQEEEAPPPRRAKRRPARDEAETDEPRRRPAAEEEEEEQVEKRPRKRRRNKRKRRADSAISNEYLEAGWRKVALGMFLCILSMWLWISEFIILIVGVVAVVGLGAALFGSGNGGLGTLAGLGAGLLLIFVLVNVAQFVGNVLNIVGQCYCGACPSEEGSLHTTAVLTFSLSASAALVSLAGQAFVLFTSGWEAGLWALLPSSGGGGWFGTIAGILNLIAEICWFKLLRGLALEAHEEGIYNQIGLYLVSCAALAFGGCLFIPCAGFLFTAMDPRHGGIPMLVMLCLFPLLMAGLTTWYMILLYKVKGCAVKLANRAARAARRG
jgi:hypothetical protein